MSLDKKEKSKQPIGFPMGKKNYQLLIASMIVVILGFVLMMGTTDIYSFTKITLAPLVVIIGFSLGVVAILWKRKGE
jgi:amino acid permease